MYFLTNKTATLFSLFGGALCILASYHFANQTLLIFSSSLFLLSLFFWKFGYILIPFFTQFTNLTINTPDFEIVPAQDVLISKTPQFFFATSYLSIELRDSTNFKSQTQKTALMEMFERALTSLNFTLKLSFLISNLDLSDHIQKIEERRSLCEHRKSQSSDSSQIASLEREINHYNSQLQLLGSGDRPLKILAYAQTSAQGLTKEEAISQVRSQAKEASATLSNSLGAQVSILRADDLLTCANWDKTPPTSKNQIDDSIF